LTIDNSQLRAIGLILRNNWRAFVATHVAASLVGYIVLLPLISALFHLSLSLSGQKALSDQEILYFALSPAGMLSLLLVGSLSILLLVFKHSALMVVAYGAEHQRPTTFISAVTFVLRRSRCMARLGARILLLVLLTVIPYLLALYAIQNVLLSAYDINFYLSNKPPQFWLAASLAVVCTLLLVYLLLHLLVSWFYALPLALFANATPSAALLQSRQVSQPLARQLMTWLLLWLLVDVVLLVTGASLVNAMGQTMIPPMLNSMQKLVVTLGLLLLLGALLTLLARACSSAFLATIMVRLFRDAGLDPGVAETASAAPTSAAALLLKPRRLAVLGLIAALSAVWLSKELIDNLAMDDHTTIIAHRGASGSAPENTLAAVSMALDEGADWVEIDVQESDDGEVVVLHDSDLKRVAGIDLKIWDATKAELADIDIGSWFSPSFSDQRVPTLREVLELCRNRAGVIIELKYYGHNVQLEQRVAAIIEATGMADDIMIMSLDSAGIQRMQQLRPQWPAGLLTSVIAGKPNTLNLDFYAINARFASRNFIRNGHNDATQVMVWTVNDSVSLSKMMSLGVDGVITDYPALGRKVLRERAALSPPERLLIELATWFGHQPQYLSQ
jgi:glycerophosphoryl diester phosphodiesterase